MRDAKMPAARLWLRCIAGACLAWATAGAAQEAGSRAATPTPEERAEAFPDLGADPHSMMLERPLNYFVLFDRLEFVDTDPDRSLAWDLDAWVGKELSRFVVRSEGRRAAGDTERADLQLLWSRSFSRWWSWVAGARLDFAPGSHRDWAAFGIEGLAPQRFEVEATAYAGEAGDTALRFEAEHEERVTNRLKLQPRIEVEWHGRSDPVRGIGAGLSSVELGLRLRYEIRREIAPYIGIGWQRQYGRTADFARAAGEDGEDTRLIAGIRLWF
jgi:copper resistance protein B